MYQTDGGVCLAWSISMILLPLLACGWWFTQCVDIFVKVYLENKTDYFKWYLMASNGYPILLTAIALGTGALGYDNYSPWCMFNKDTTDSRQFVIFYGQVIAVRLRIPNN